MSVSSQSVSHLPALGVSRAWPAWVRGVLRTSHQGKLDTPQYGIKVKVRDVERLLQLLLVDLGYGRLGHVWLCQMVWQRMKVSFEMQLLPIRFVGQAASSEGRLVADDTLELGELMTTPTKDLEVQCRHPFSA
jgi:hypothetical protein